MLLNYPHATPSIIRRERPCFGPRESLEINMPAMKLSVSGLRYGAVSTIASRAEVVSKSAIGP
jgi:hypothetical protein